MYSTLADVLRADGALDRITADCQHLVEQELAGRSGVSAAALKVAYKAVTAFAPGYYQSVVASLVPEMLAALQPFWTNFHAAGGGQFGDYLAKHGEAVAESLIGVTDDLAGRSERPAIVRTYGTVRGGAGNHIEAALPAVGALVEKYAG